MTGWRYNVLSQSTEASKSQLSKYTSALMILMMVWSITGYCFAQRYIELPIWACALVSLFFVLVVINIERQIILATEKSKWVAIFRVVIALIMAVIGSTIVDQTMFGKDIDKQMSSTIEQQTSDLSQQRLVLIEESLEKVTHKMDSITAVTEKMQEEVLAKPFVIQTSTTTVPVTVDGKVKMKPSVTTTEVPNPKQQVIDENNKVLKELREHKRKLEAQKQTVVDDTRKELTENVGFLEELEAMWAIISSRPMAGFFYVVFFLFIMSLELFVVVSKFGDHECDYERSIKGAQIVRIAQLDANFKSLNQR